MPAAAPLPRHPGALIMDGAAALLTAPGCPVCRYTGEASDRNLSWFALEGHADESVIGRLATSLGPCARHTRRLMSQPGARVRLTAVYQYILRAARERLTGRVITLGTCPMCEHDQAAAARALDTLIEGLADEPVRQRCREVGGLCVPHLTAAADGPRRTAAWLAETMAATLISQSPRLEWVAGDFDHDAELRAVLMRAMPAALVPGSYVCLCCLAGTRAERACVTRVAGLSRERLPGDPELLLCASHLGDAAVLAGRGPRLTSLLAWQANCLIALGGRHSAPVVRVPARTILTRRRGARRQPGSTGCAACRAQAVAVQHAVDEFRQALRAAPIAPDRQAALCVRHVLGLRTVDPWAGQVITRGAVDRADALIAELAEAFRKNTWGHRHEAAGTEATAWRRAAAYLDGGVFCGSPPRRV